MSELTDFLLARIAEDEAVAREATSGDFEGGDAEWCAGWLGSGIRHLVRNVDIECYEPGHEDDPGLCGRPARYAGEHVAHWDPVRVLAECEAKRRIVEAATITIDRYGSGTVLDLAWEALRALALPYADHEDYREERKP